MYSGLCSNPHPRKRSYNNRLRVLRFDWPEHHIDTYVATMYHYGVSLIDDTMTDLRTSEDILSPDDIRRIREGLGLTQVEAGEILGGGPRAFTKYESGTIKPAASVANLLRLLESTPQALTTLAGRASVPIENDSSRPLEVTAAHVMALSPRRLAVLVERLLVAEALAGCLPMEGIHIAAEITAGDGGEDARIAWSGGPDHTPYLPRRLTQFQLKATKLSPAAAAAEVRTSNGALQPMVREVMSAGGGYVLVLSQTSVKQKLNKHEASIREAVRAAGLIIDDEQVSVRDASQIANWANAHPSVAAWLLQRTQPGIAGPFRDWTHWAGRYEHERSPWVVDARLPAFQRGLRELITAPRGVARILGPSGVGKSRLTLQALGPDDQEEKSRIGLWGLVLYAVESEAGGAAIKNAVQVLADAGVRAIVVVDRCDPETHQDLAGIAKRLGSRLSLITIDHEVPRYDKPPPGVLLVPKADSAMMEGIVAEVARKYPQEERRRIVHFAKGYPHAAILIADAWSRDQPLAAATDDALLDRVVLGRRPHSPDDLRKAGMLLSTFGLVGIKVPYEDVTNISKLPGAPDEAALRAAFVDLQARRVAQLRGRLLTLQPLSVALPLAARQWAQWDQATWDSVLAGHPSAGLRVRAARQLALLNQLEISREVVRAVCRHNGPFDSLDALLKPEATKVLSSLAEADPNAVVALLDRVLEPATIEDLGTIADDARRSLVRTLMTIAFHEATFEQGARHLMRLAAAENESWTNNATGQFNALFHVIAGETQASAHARLRFLDDALEADDPRILKVSVGAVLAGAETGSVVRTLGATGHYGTRPALSPWRPKFWNEVWDYIGECLRRLAKLATRPDEAGLQAKVGVGHRFRTLVSQGCIDLVEDLVGTVTSASGPYWPQAHESLGHILVYDREGLDADVEKRVRVLIDRLTPTDMAARVKALVTEMPWDYPIGEPLDYKEREARQLAAVDELATELLADPDQLTQFLTPLSRGGQRMTFQFGQALAKRATTPLQWKEPILDAYAGVPEGDRNFGILAGFISGLASRHPEVVDAFKAEAASSPTFAIALPLLCHRLGITPDDVSLVCASVASGHLRTDLLSQWTFGGALAKLSPSAVAPLFDLLLTRDDGYALALDLIGMYVHGQRGRLDALRAQLLLAAQNIDRLTSGRQNRTDAYHLKELMDWILAKGPADQDACKVALTLAKKIVDLDAFDTTELARSLLPQLLASYSEIVWPILGEAIVSDRANGWRLEHSLGDNFSFDVKQPPILRLPPNLLFAWCHAHPDVAPAFVAGLLPILTNRDAEKSSPSLHPLVIRLLDEFGDRTDVMQALTRNMYTFGWTGSRTAYFALYDQPLSALESHPRAEVRKWTKRTRGQLRRDIDETRTEEEERDANWDM